ncbi:hypothetical protein L1D16_22240, partial [Vibrio sp. Isolate31]|nr:hypothetical protein [Vibrio sp. Isolate31]
MKKLVSLLLAAVSLGLSGCATVLTAEQSAPQLNEVPQEKALTIAVIDKRPYVLDHDKEPKFEGIIRSSLGIPYTDKEPKFEGIIRSSLGIPYTY